MDNDIDREKLAKFITDFKKENQVRTCPTCGGCGLIKETDN